MQILQRMEARDKAAEEQTPGRPPRPRKEGRRRAQGLERERALAAEERRRQDMLRMFRAISTRQEEEEPRRQHSEDYREFPPGIGMAVTEGRTAIAAERCPHRPAAGARGTDRH